MCLFLFLALEKEAVLMKTSYDEGFSERHKVHLSGYVSRPENNSPTSPIDLNEENPHIH